MLVCMVLHHEVELVTTKLAAESISSNQALISNQKQKNEWMIYSWKDDGRTAADTLIYFLMFMTLTIENRRTHTAL